MGTMTSAVYQDTVNLSYMFDSFHKYEGVFSEAVLCIPSTYLAHRVFILMHKCGMR
jgi:hypothetical protein